VCWSKRLGEKRSNKKEKKCRSEEVTMTIRSEKPEKVGEKKISNVTYLEAGYSKST
jgi:hypothetical protein